MTKTKSATRKKIRAGDDLTVKASTGSSAATSKSAKVDPETDKKGLDLKPKHKAKAEAKTAVVAVKKTEACNCGSTVAYGKCCGGYIAGNAFPETAEQLMRSRYTAYTQCNIDYIEATTKEAALADFDRAQALHLAKNSTWHGLKVLEYRPHPQDSNQAMVKFDAYFSINGKQGHIHETSKFKRIDNKWYYVDGR